MTKPVTLTFGVKLTLKWFTKLMADISGTLLNAPSVKSHEMLPSLVCATQPDVLTSCAGTIWSWLLKFDISLEQSQGNNRISGSAEGMKLHIYICFLTTYLLRRTSSSCIGCWAVTQRSILTKRYPSKHRIHFNGDDYKIFFHSLLAAVPSDANRYFLQRFILL